MLKYRNPNVGCLTSPNPFKKKAKTLPNVKLHFIFLKKPNYNDLKF